MSGKNWVQSETPKQTGDRRTFDQPPDPSLLRFNSRDLLSAEAVEKELAPFLDGLSDKDIPGNYRFLNNTALSRVHIIQLRGSPIQSANRVQDILKALKGPTGKWRQFFVKTPNGEASKLFIGPDTNRLQRATISVGRHLLTAAKRHIQDDQLDLFKRDGILAFNWVHVA